MNGPNKKSLTDSINGVVNISRLVDIAEIFDVSLDTVSEMILVELQDELEARSRKQPHKRSWNQNTQKN